MTILSRGAALIEEVSMTDSVFQQAYKAVRLSYSEEAWGALSPRQITEAIYGEIRRLDASRAAAANPGGEQTAQTVS